MSSTAELEPLARYTELMNELLPVKSQQLLIYYYNHSLQQVHDVEGDEQPSVKDRQKLLCDMRSVRDACWRDRMRAENQLFAAQQTVIALSSQLRMAEEKLVSIEDLIGEVGMRMYKRGLKSHPTMRWKHQPPQPSTIGNNSPQCMYTF